MKDKSLSDIKNLAMTLRDYIKGEVLSMKGGYWPDVHVVDKPETNAVYLSFAIFKNGAPNGEAARAHYGMCLNPWKFSCGTMEIHTDTDNAAAIKFLDITRAIEVKATVFYFGAKQVDINTGYTINKWMLDIGLKGTELQVYALIANRKEPVGGLDYFEKWIGRFDKTITNALKALVAKGLIRPVRRDGANGLKLYTTNGCAEQLQLLLNRTKW